MPEPMGGGFVSRDRLKQSYTVRCETCPWKFRCPVEQIKTRVQCRACESHAAEKTAQAR